MLPCVPVACARPQPHGINKLNRPDYPYLSSPRRGDAGRNAVGIILVVLNALTAAAFLWYIALVSGAVVRLCHTYGAV